MNDLISRQDAINLLKKWSGGYDYIETETESAIKDFQNLPSAQIIISCKDCVHLEVLNSEQYYARCNWHGRLFPSFGKPNTRYYFCADCQRREDGTKQD